jgi:SAM-dependent methyltransferase
LKNRFLTCPGCGSSDQSSFLAKENMFGLGGEFEYFHCADCEALWIGEIPLDLEKYYSRDYYAFKKIEKSSFLVTFLKKLRFQISKFGIRIKPPVYFRWLSELNADEEKRIADIGCGNGILLHELKACGFRNLFGFDPFIEQGLTERGLEVRKESFDEITGEFDILMFHHSFEHLEDPRIIFSKANKLLPNGGKMLIRVPVTDSEVWKMEREFWFQLDAPRHLFLPNTKTIKALAGTYGFKLSKVDFDSSGNQFWITKSYKSGKSFVEIDFKTDFSKKELKKWDREAVVLNRLGKGDQACFYLEKIGNG